MSRALIFGFFIVAGAVAFERASAAEKRPEKQRYCPVFTDRIVGPGSRSLRFRGIKVYFSSDLAARKWMRDPVSYLDKSLLPQLTDLTLPERFMAQKYCPIHPKWKVSIRDPSVMHDGKRVFLFDQQALRAWNSAPEKFLDPKILPQFAEEPAPADEEPDGSMEEAPPAGSP